MFMASSTRLGAHKHGAPCKWLVELPVRTPFFNKLQGCAAVLPAGQCCRHSCSDSILSDAKGACLKHFHHSQQLLAVAASPTQGQNPCGSPRTHRESGNHYDFDLGFGAQPPQGGTRSGGTISDMMEVVHKHPYSTKEARQVVRSEEALISSHTAVLPGDQ